MPVRVRCPNPSCGKTSACPDAALGKSVKCPACGVPFVAQDVNTLSGSVAVPAPGVAESTTGRTAETVGRFVLVSRLGSGAFGTVYKAHDPQLRRDVALKVPNPGMVSDPKRAERFLREAQSAAGLRHPNIVPVFDTGRDGDRFFIASALIDGQPLADAIPEGGMDTRRAAEIARQLADAVGYAHAQGIVHRDIKPANVLLDADGRPHLTDFGLAARAEDSGKLTNEGAILGTPSYMAPEQAAGQYGDAKPAADQYALGVVLYELLTGRTPFQGPPAVAMYHAIHSPPPAPSSFRPDLSPELEAVCLRALAKNPAERFPDCKALAAELGNWLAVRELPRAPPAPSGVWGTESAPPPRPRSQILLFAAMGSVAVVLAALAAGAAWYALSGRKPAVASAPAAPTAPADDPDDPPDPPPQTRVTRSGSTQWGGLGRWAKEGDELVGSVNPKQAAVMSFGEGQWTDYDYTAEFQVTFGYPSCTFLFRTVSPENHCAFSFGPMGRATFVVREVKPVKVDKDRPGKLVQGVWYAIKISTRKDLFQVELTEAGKPTPVLTAEHRAGRHPAGRCGITLGMPDTKSSGKIRVRKLEVKAPDGTVLWSGIPDPP